MHTFFVLSGCKGDKPEQFKRRPISHKMPGRFVLESAEGVCTEYDSTEELLKHLRADSKHIRPQMGTGKTTFFLSRCSLQCSLVYCDSKHIRPQMGTGKTTFFLSRCSLQCSLVYCDSKHIRPQMGTGKTTFFLSRCSLQYSVLLFIAIASHSTPDGYR